MPQDEVRGRVAVEISKELQELFEAESMKEPIPGIASIMCCQIDSRQIQLVTSRPGMMYCPECDTGHEITEQMVRKGYSG